MGNAHCNKRQSQALLHVMVIGSVLVAAFALSAFPICNYDIWHHLEMGEYVFEHRGVPAEDLFSFASTRPWVNPAWLAGVVFHLLFHAGGPGALIVFKACVATLAMALMLRSALREGARPLVAAVAAICVLYSIRVRLICRPLIFSTLFLAAAIAIFRDFAAGRRSRLWVLPILCLAWANLHAGFFAAFILFPIYLFEELRRPQSKDVKLARVRALVVCGVCCVAATLVNPFGLRALIHPFTLTSSAHLSLTAEWQPMSFGWHWFRPDMPSFLHAYAFFWAGLALLVISIAVTRKSLRSSDALTVVIFTAMVVSGRRHVDLFGVATFPILAKHLSLALSFVARSLRAANLWDGVFRRRLVGLWRAHPTARACHAALALGIVAGGFWLRFGIDGHRFGFGINERLYPHQAADFIQANRLSGRMLNYWSWGPYLIWRFHPERKVFADGRFEVYDAKVFSDWLVMNEGRPGWESVADRYQINYTVIAASPEHTAAFQSERWKLIYWDDLCVIFIRNMPANRALIDRYECSLTHPVFVLQHLENPEDIPVMEAQLRAKLHADPACARAHGNLAKLLVKTGRWAEAALMFEQVTKLKPWSPSAQHDLGMCLLEVGRLDEAIRAFAKVIHMPTPTSRRALAYVRLADCWLRKGDSQRAARCYRKALRLAPGNEEAREGLAAARRTR